MVLLFVFSASCKQGWILDDGDCVAGLLERPNLVEGFDVLELDKDVELE